MRDTLARLLPPAAVILLVGTGCTYVGQKTFNEKRDSLDEDGDGCPKSNDCDDANKFVCVNFTEVPYDGWDNDCGRDGDLVDVDGDGQPGITRAEWEARNEDPKRPDWPEDVADGTLGVDCRDVLPEQLDQYVWIDTTLTEDDLAEYKPDRTDAPEDLPETHPNAATISPLASDDPSYDGIDQDCDESNDFDFDGDGYMPPEDELVDGGDQTYGEAFAAFKDEWGYSFDSELFGDCKDAEAPINPGVTEDPFFDGEDADCDGTNDFDQDGDEYIPFFTPDGDEVQALYDAFVAKYHPDGVPWNEPWTVGDSTSYDCADYFYQGFEHAIAESKIYPGAYDVPYDGIDADCGYDNDFDLDVDGFRDEAVVDAFYDTFMGSDTVTATWNGVYTTAPDVGVGDCDDTDPLVLPGTLEFFGDVADQDCDGGDDTTPFAFDELEWGEARTPIVGATDYHYILTDTATYLDQQIKEQKEVGLTLLFELDAGYNEPVFNQPLLWQGTTQIPPLGKGVDAISDPSTIYAATSYYLSSNNNVYLIMRQLPYNAGNGLYGQQLVFRGRSGDDPYLDIDMRVDDAGDIWVAGCNEDVLHYFTANSATGQIGYRSVAFETGIDGGDLCFLETPLDSPKMGIAHVCQSSGAGCTSYDIDSDSETITLAAAQPYDAAEFVAVTTTGDYLAAPLATGGVFVRDLATDETWMALEQFIASHADLVFHDGLWYMAAVVERTNILGLGGTGRGGSPPTDKAVIIASGPTLDELSFAEYPFYRREDDGSRTFDWEPTSVSIYVDDDRIFLGVGAENAAGVENEDAVGWLFLGQPTAP